MDGLSILEAWFISHKKSVPVNCNGLKKNNNKVRRPEPD